MGCHAACPKATVLAAHQTLLPRVRVKLHSLVVTGTLS